MITSSSDKLHYAEGEEMNEELLKGSFQLLISQLKPGAFFFLFRYSELLYLLGRGCCERQNQESPFTTAYIGGFLH